MKNTLMQACFAMALGIGCCDAALAQLSVSGGIEYFRWRESTAPRVTESGPRFAAGLNWTQDRDAGWLGAYRGKLYTGRVDYEGALLLTGAPLNSHTTYNGITNEIQAIYRSSRGDGNTIDYVGGLGWDYWTRRLSAAQKEDYSVAFLRLGVDLNSRTKQGWLGGGGIKYAAYVREDAHLTDIGFDQNPTLHPGKNIDLYAQLGYRFGPRWDLIGYYDGYRFSQSDSVPVTARASFPGATFNVFQPKSTMNVFGLKLQYTY